MEDELLGLYWQKKAEAAHLKKQTDDLNAKIKAELEKLGLDEYEGTCYTVTQSRVNRDKLNEDQLIDKLRQILPEDLFRQVVVTREILVLDKVQDLVYNRIIEADTVNDCITHEPPTIRLNIRERKNND